MVAGALYLSILVTALSAAQPLAASDVPEGPPSPSASAGNKDEGKKDTNEGEKKEDSDPLARFKFGGAIGVSMDLADGDPVNEATVVNGIVRSSQTAAARPRVLLEVHRPFITFHPKPRSVKVRLPEMDESGNPLKDGKQIVQVGISERAGWAVGPFAAVQSGGNSVVDGFAAGVMFSILRDASTGSDFNIGVGAMLDEKVKFLGDGLVDGQPLPPGETEIRFKEKASWSFVILFSMGQ
jgi:hypothetical protein